MIKSKDKMNIFSDYNQALNVPSKQKVQGIPLLPVPPTCKRDSDGNSYLCATKKQISVALQSSVPEMACV